MLNVFSEVGWKKVLLWGVLFFSIVAVLVFFVVKPGASKEEQLAVDENIEVTQEVFSEVEPVVKGFMATASNFGYNSEKVFEANSFLEVQKTIVDSPKSVDPAMYRSREVAYLDTKERFIAAGSPLDYTTSIVASWPASIEFGTKNRLFSIKDVFVVKPDTMRKTNIDGVLVDTISVDVSFHGTIQTALRDSHGTDWDGSYRIMEKQFPEQKVSVQLVNFSDGWKVFNVRMDSNRFFLSTWKNPEPGIYSDELNNNFSEVSIVFTDIELPNVDGVDDGGRNPNESVGGPENFVDNEEGESHGEENHDNENHGEENHDNVEQSEG